MNVIMIRERDLEPDNRVRLDGRQARHVREILGGTIGRSLRVGLLNGRLGRGTIEATDDETVTVHCTFDRDPPDEPAIDLILALPRPKVLKRLWPQLSALGVRRIFVTNAEKVERHYFDTHWLVKENYEPLLLEGMEQAGDTRLPEVRLIRRLKPFLEDEAHSLFGAIRLVAHPLSEKTLQAMLDAPGEVVMAIGPEGGWTAFELDLFEHADFRPVGMGHRVLRSDTACVGLLTALRILLSG